MTTSSEQLAKRLKFWTTLAVALAAGGFSTAVYLNRYALASNVDELNNKVMTHETRITTVEEQGKRIEEDLHQVARQLFEIARAVGAQDTPVPAHRKEHQ